MTIFYLFSMGLLPVATSLVANNIELPRGVSTVETPKPGGVTASIFRKVPQRQNVGVQPCKLSFPTTVNANYSFLFNRSNLVP